METQIIHDFERVFQNLHSTLVDAKVYYKELFNSMVSGIDISKNLEADCHAIQISTIRKELHVKQAALSNAYKDDTKVYSVSELYGILKDEFSIDIVQLSKKCLGLYDELQSFTKAIELFYASKVEEYRDFFEKIYKDMNKDTGYTKEKEDISKKGGLLISANA